MNEAFEKLVYRHFMGELTEAENASLAQSLDSDKRARETFVRLAEEETALRECLATMPSTLAIPRPVPKKIVPFKKQRTWWPAAMAACLILGIGTLLLFPQKHNLAASNQSIARIANVTGSAEWKPGEILHPGIVEIHSGELNLLFHSGTTVILQGPCRVNLDAARSWQGS